MRNFLKKKIDAWAIKRFDKCYCESCSPDTLEGYERIAKELKTARPYLKNFKPAQP